MLSVKSVDLIRIITATTTTTTIITVLFVIVVNVTKAESCAQKSPTRLVTSLTSNEACFTLYRQLDPGEIFPA